MVDALIKETTPPPKPAEAPATTAAVGKSEVLPATPPPVEKVEAGTARATLEKIAAGVPVAEATTPPEAPKTPSEAPYAAKTATAPAEAAAPAQAQLTPEAAKEALPNREEVTKLLGEANALLLELRDFRLLVTAVATQAVDTPLGSQMRAEALRMLGEMKLEGLPAEPRARLTSLQEKIKALNLPAAKPEESALLTLINKHNELHPDQKVPEVVVEKIKAGKLEVAPAVADLLRTNSPLSQAVWTELTGRDGFTELPLTAENVLALSGLPPTPENTQAITEMFGKAKTMKEKASVTSMLLPGLMVGAMGFMFLSQLASSPEGSGGH